MLEKKQVLRQMPPLPQPDPSLGNIRIGIKPSTERRPIRPRTRLLILHQMRLDLANLSRREPGAPIGPRRIGEIAGDVGYVGVVGAEAVVRGLSPIKPRTEVPRPDGTTCVGALLSVLIRVSGQISWSGFGHTFRPTIRPSRRASTYWSISIRGDRLDCTVTVPS